MRFWPDNGGWWEAEVHNYNASTGQHRFVPCPIHCLPSLVNKFLSDRYVSAVLIMTLLQSPLSRIQRTDIIVLATFH